MAKSEYVVNVRVTFLPPFFDHCGPHIAAGMAVLVLQAHAKKCQVRSFPSAGRYLLIV